jgi:MFS family permease
MAVGQIIGPYFAGLLVDQFGLNTSILTSSAILGISAIFSFVYGAAQRFFEKREPEIRQSFHV